MVGSESKGKGKDNNFRRSFHELSLGLKEFFKGPSSVSEASSSSHSRPGTASPGTITHQSTANSSTGTSFLSRESTLTPDSRSHSIPRAVIVAAAPVLPEHFLRNRQKSTSAIITNPKIVTVDFDEASDVGAATPSEVNKDFLLQDIKNVQGRLKEVNEKWLHKERMRKILQGIEDVAQIVDVAIQHSPEISSLVWAGARFILLVAKNKVDFIENLEAVMITMVEKIATCEFYAQIYDESLRVQSHPAESGNSELDAPLKDLYLAVGNFLKKALTYLDPGKSRLKKIGDGMKSFGVSMQPLIEEILQKEETVKNNASMATMQRIKDNSSKLRVVEGVVIKIQGELKPLAKIEEILNRTINVEENLAKFQDQIFQALQPHQDTFLLSDPLDSELQELKDRYHSDFQRTDIFQANLYIPARGMCHQNSPEEEHFDLEGRLEEFLSQDTPQQICLIQGAAGSGKSTFNHYIATKLWKAYESTNATGAIPIFIPLANLHDSTRHNQDLVAELFKRRNWTEQRILKARQELRFIFILDGYDEIEKRDRNFYLDNRLEDWNAKTIITTRPEYLGSGYHSKFYPPGNPQLLQEYWLAPFSIDEIREYISKYVKMIPAHASDASSRSVENYEQLVQRPEVRTLISNPFLLNMVMTVQPSTGETELKRVTLYRKFLDLWFDESLKRWHRVQIPPRLADSFKMLEEEEDFAQSARSFCLDFAVELYRQKSLEASYNSSPRGRRQKTWRPFLCPEDPRLRLLRYSSPLVRVGGSYRFLHKSLRDYAIAESLSDVEGMLEPDSLFNEFNIVNDPGVIDFIVQEAESNEMLQRKLLECVEESKHNPQAATAAANAITILVRAGKRFHRFDLKGVRIPGADISTGWFQHAQLQNADLSKVNLARVWMRGANLSGACVERSWFGEKPSLRLNIDTIGHGVFMAFCYTANAELLAAMRAAGSGPESSDVQIWSATNHKLLYLCKGHQGVIDCCTFSPDGNLLATGSSEDETIRIWTLDIQRVHEFPVQPTVQTINTLFRSWTRTRETPYYDSCILALAISPNTQLLAANGRDEERNFVCLWSLTTNQLTHVIDQFAYSSRINVLNPHPIHYDVVFSPDMRVLAIFSHGQLSLLDLSCLSNPEGVGNRLANSDVNQVHNHDSSLIDHTGPGVIQCIAFGLNGGMLAYADSEMGINLWSVTHGRLIRRFESGHRDSIIATTFSPNDHMIATLSNDSTVRIWSVGSQELIRVVPGVLAITNCNCPVLFSKDSHLVANLGLRGSVRQTVIPENAQGGVQSAYTQSHILNDFHYVAFSPHAKLLALTNMHTERVVYVFRIELLSAPQLLYTHELRGLSPSGVTITSLRTTNGDIDALIAMPFERNGKGHVHLQSLMGGKRHSEVILDYRATDGTNIKRTAFAADGTLIAITHAIPGRIDLWSTKNNERIHTYYVDSALADEADLVTFSPNGQLLLSSSGNAFQLWSITTHELLHIFRDHTKTVSALEFSPDGRMIASASEDATVRLWSAFDYNALHIFEHPQAVYSVAFSPKGALLLSGAEDGTARFWSIHSKRLVHEIDVQGKVNSFTWGTYSSPKSEIIAVGTRNGWVQLWKITKSSDYRSGTPSIEVDCFWASNQGHYLNATDTQIHGLTGLTADDLELLKQRKAIGEPAMVRVIEVEKEKEDSS